MSYSQKLLLSIVLLMSVSTHVLAKNSPKQNRDQPPRLELTTIDINGDGEIDFDEFAQFAQFELPFGDHQTAFSHIDSDDNGIISSEELESHKPPKRDRN